MIRTKDTALRTLGATIVWTSFALIGCSSPEKPARSDEPRSRATGPAATTSGSPLSSGSPASSAARGNASAKAPLEESKRPEHEEIIAAATRAIRSIAFAAQAAYEREQMAAGSNALVHALCKSASPVPAKVPAPGEKFTPSDADWGQDTTVGWGCLRYATTEPTSFQYTYIAGGPYKSTARGNANPGADGFEVCAEADFVPGGSTTLVCQTGTVDAAKSMVVMSPDTFVDDEYEPDTTPPPPAPSDATPESVCKALERILGDGRKADDADRKHCIDKVSKDLAAKPDRFACAAGCATIQDVAMAKRCLKRKCEIR